METGLRIILILIGIAIIAGIVWDFRRNASKKNPKNINRDRSALDTTLEDDDLLDAVDSLDDMSLDIPYEEDYVQTSTIRKTSHYPATSQYSVSNQYSSPKPSAPKTKDTPQTTASNTFSEIVVLHVMARRPNLIMGNKLIDAMNEVHLYFNDDQIFERYENIDGTGNPVFSLVSAVEPGYFELSKIQDFKTPGVTLFFSLKQPNQAVAAFELMLRTAKILATRLDAELKDDKHQLLGSETIERYRERVRQQPIMGSARA